VPSYSSPASLFAMMFLQGRPEEVEAQVRRLQDGRSVLDAVGHDAKRLQRGLGPADRAKLDLPETATMVWVDGALMTQVLINLLDNSLRYAPDGRVFLGARETPDGMRIEVADEGPGFGDQPTEPLFSRFVRGANEPAKSVRGSGLGLSICRAIVQAHGGTIEARNRPAGGALFRIELPWPEGIERPRAQSDEDAA